jgi:probable HAF family extracellular repeat protein
VAYRCPSQGACVEVPFNVGGSGRSVVEPTDVTDDGTIIGSGPINAVATRGFKWDGVNPLTYFKPFDDECEGCYLNSYANAINRRGDVVGQAQGHIYYAVVYGPDNLPHKLPDLGGARSAATGISNDGLIVGTAERPDGLRRAWVYDGTQITEIGTQGSDWSTASGVNEHHQVIGCSATAANERSQGFIYQDGVTTPLPNLCPSAINRHGLIVGSRFLYIRGKTFELDKLLVKADRATWTITRATAINNNDQIAAEATHRTTGARRAVVLTPTAP